MTDTEKPWNQPDAILCARLAEMVCQEAGCHVALTGGTLYKDGPRKDCDLLFYRIRQVKEIDMPKLWVALATVGIVKQSGWGWCFKATWTGRNLDIFFPEEQRGPDYIPKGGV